MNRSREVLDRKRIKRACWAVELEMRCSIVNDCVQRRQQPPLDTLMKIVKILDIDAKDLTVSNKF